MSSVTIESACTNIYRATKANDVCFCVSIPNKFLYQWYAAHLANSATTMVSQLNKQLVGVSLLSSLEMKLKMKGARLTTNAKQGYRKKIMSQSTLMDVLTSDIVNPNEAMEVLR